MFDSADVLDDTDLGVVAALLAGAGVPADAAGRIDRLEALERLKSAACAAQRSCCCSRASR